MKTIELTNEQWEKLQSGEDVTLKAPKAKFEYPIYAREHIFPETIVKFTSLCGGVIIEGGSGIHNSGSCFCDWVPHTDAGLWEILPDYREKPEQWEPKGVPYRGEYYCVDEHCDVTDWPNCSSEYDHSLAQCGNMSVEKWQAEEIAKRNRANNRIAQYVFEHMKEGEERNSGIVCDTNGYWRSCHTVSGPTVVPMPLRVARMLCDDLNSGRVKL